MHCVKFHALLTVLAFAVIIMGCSGQAGPTFPANSGNLSTMGRPTGTNHQLWGTWHVSVDPISMAFDVTPLRGVMFTCNVTKFMQPPASPVNVITFEMQPQSIPADGYFMVRVSLRHPFVGTYYYNGFDVRGIFLSDGSLPGMHDSTVLRAGPGDSRLLNPDGYTRFWNPTEFTSFSTIFGFTHGKMVGPNEPTSTVNPYKYFADGFEEDDGVETLDPSTRGIFTAGTVNSRIYEIQFEMDGGPVFDFNYAVDASWSEPDPAYVPLYPPDAFDISANAQEALFMKATDAGSTAYYVDPSVNGGSFKFDLEIFDRQGNMKPGGVPGQISKIWVESDALGGPVDVLGSAMVMPGSTEISSVYEVELADVSLTSSGTVEFFATIESSDPVTYEPAVDGGSAFAYPDVPLAAYFTFTGNIKDTAPVEDWPTVPVLIDPDHQVNATHFAVDVNGTIHSLYQDLDHVYWSTSSDKGNTWTNKGIIYSAASGHIMFRQEIAMTATDTHVYCLVSEWDGESGIPYTNLSAGRLDTSNIDLGWEFKEIWVKTSGSSADQNYSGLQIAVDNQGNIMVYAMLYNFASFISRFGYVPDWDSLTGAAEQMISPLENGYLTYYYPQPTVEMVADSLGQFFMVFGGNFNDNDNYNGSGQDFGLTMIRYTPSSGKWRFVQTISHPGGAFYWNSWASGLAVSEDDHLYWVGSYSHDNCGFYGLQGGYYVLSYGTGLSTGDHDFYFDDPINDYHNCYAECDLDYEYWGYDLMFVSASIGVDPDGNAVIAYQRSRNYCHLMVIRNDGSGWSDPPIQIDGGLLAQNPYGRMHPSGWYLITFTDSDMYSNGTGLPYFVAWK